MSRRDSTMSDTSMSDTTFLLFAMIIGIGLIALALTIPNDKADDWNVCVRENGQGEWLSYKPADKVEKHLVRDAATDHLCGVPT